MQQTHPKQQATETTHILNVKDGAPILNSAFNSCFWLTVILAVVYLGTWARTTPLHEVYSVVFWSSACLVKRAVIYAANAFVSWHWALPVYLGMPQEDVRLFHLPGSIPVDKWLAMYGERRVLVRDALQRKVPHFLSLVIDTVLWTTALQSNVSPSGLLAVSVLYRFACVLLQGFALRFASEVSETCWVYLSASVFTAARIRDGRYRWQNLTMVVLGTFWGLILAKVVWSQNITVLFPQSESALLLQLMWLPVAVGDAMAEIVGCCFGRRYFEVSGVGEVNRKTLEGVAAMFLSTWVACVLAVAVAAHSGFLVSASVWTWISVSTMIAIGTTMAETWSPRSTDNLTIPLTGCAVLYVFGVMLDHH